MKIVFAVLALFLLVSCRPAPSHSSSDNQYVVLADGVEYECRRTNATHITTPHVDCDGKLYLCLVRSYVTLSFIKEVGQTFIAYCDNDDIYLNVTDIKFSARK